MNTITLAQEKGGVGKTTLAVTLAAGLAERGHRVVLVDADAQASATSALGIEEQPGIYDLLIRKHSFQNVLCTVSPETWSAAPNAAQGELYVVPGNVETRNIANMLSDIQAILITFSALDEWADFIVIDTPPTPSLWHSPIYLASDYVIYPALAEAASLESLAKTISRLHPLGQMRQQIGKTPTQTLGIVPTMYRLNTSLHLANIEILRERYGPLVKDGCPQRVAWGEAAQVGKTIFAYEPRNGAYAEAKIFVDAMLAGMAVDV